MARHNVTIFKCKCMLQKQIGFYFLRGEKEKHVCSVAWIACVMSMLLF